MLLLRPRMLLPRSASRCPLHAAAAILPTPASADRILHVSLPPSRLGTPLVTAVAKAARIDESAAAALIELGAVWSAASPPPRPAAPHVALDARQRRAAKHALVLAEGPAGGKAPERAMDPSRVLPQAGSYLRIHLQPRRFPVAHSTDWAARVLHRGGGIVVVNKPAGIQVGPTTDNALECVAACVAAALGVPSLRVPHRLDGCTSGLLVLAETRAAAARLGDAFASGAAGKTYLALASAAVPEGRMTSLAQVGFKAPGQPRLTRIFDSPAADAGTADGAMADADVEGLLLCQQTVLRCRPAGEGCASRAAWELEIELETGRTHQIRAMLAHRGAPLLGDTLYGAGARGGGAAPAEPAAVALHSWRLRLTAGEKESAAWGGVGKFEVPPPWRGGDGERRSWDCGIAAL